MRHLYQKHAVEIFLLNRFLGAKSFPQLESDKKCTLWEQELKEYKLGDGLVWGIEEDADAFANYLIHRYPTVIPMKTTNGRIGALKSDRQFAQQGKRNGMHSLYRMRKELPPKRAVTNSDFKSDRQIGMYEGVI